MENACMVCLMFAFEDEDNQIGLLGGYCEEKPDWVTWESAFKIKKAIFLSLSWYKRYAKLSIFSLVCSGFNFHLPVMYDLCWKNPYLERAAALMDEITEDHCRKFIILCCISNKTWLWRRGWREGFFLLTCTDFLCYFSISITPPNLFFESPWWVPCYMFCKMNLLYLSLALFLLLLQIHLNSPPSAARGNPMLASNSSSVEGHLHGVEGVFWGDETQNSQIASPIWIWNRSSGGM